MHPLLLLIVLGLSHALPVVRANDNRVAAGTMRNGELQIRLVVKMARWYPNERGGPYTETPVFAVEGEDPQIPGPMIRVPTGTTIVATVRNALPDSTVYLRGFTTRPAKALDSIPLRRGATRTFRFSAGEPGTYFYHAAPGILDPTKVERETALGALIVDPVGPVTPDRVFVINIWGQRVDTSNAVAINGRSWPFTERISATVGDTLRWRVINGSIRNHPMHLHGFYFRVDQRGDGATDTIYTESQRRMAVTEDFSAWNTAYMVWSPDRPGGWLFHCHISFHVVVERARLFKHDRHRNPHLMMMSPDAREHMSGLVLGINVQPRPGAQPVSRENVRRLRLFIDEGKRRGFAKRSLGYVVQRGDREPAEDSVELPGSVLVLTRGEPTDITVINRLNEATAVHWHGIELESYSDGVAGWSGMPKHVAPAIAARDSFTARLTLPRAGTFMYHTHLNDIEQLTSGLYGGLIVLEPGQRYDPATDHLFVSGWDGDVNHSITNGDSTGGPPIEIKAGTTHKFRFVNIGPAQRLLYAIRRDSSVMKWKAVAKDGADLPGSLGLIGPAIRRLGVGEMFDAEFTPGTPGEYRLTIGPPLKQEKFVRRIIVR
jgi:FtsP/CotA-like multicopper oxidase with cupredoxin domain